MSEKQIEVATENRDDSANTSSADAETKHAVAVSCVDKLRDVTARFGEMLIHDSPFNNELRFVEL